MNSLLGAVLITLSILLLRFDDFRILTIRLNKDNIGQGDYGFTIKLIIITHAIWWILLQFNF